MTTPHRGPMCSLAVAIALAAASPAAGDAPTIKIGVISPESGQSGSAGLAHRASIDWAMKSINYDLMTGDQHVVLTTIFENDQGNPEESARLARKLVTEDQVVAILGPVNSDCTAAVLREDLHTPVISSLSSAPSLTIQRNRWFFRATIDDRTRMRRFTQYLRDRNLLGAQIVALYQDDEYGRGLQTSLAESSHSIPVAAKPWQDVEADPRGVVASFPAEPVSLFVLGGEEHAVDIANRLRPLLVAARSPGTFRFFFVGGGERLQRSAPEDSITIGEPVPDTADEALLDVPEMIRPFMTSSQEFLLPTFEAARYVLPKALGYALETGVLPTNVPRLRDALRTVLEQKQFDSMAPQRKIKFANGDLEEPPSTPILQVRRTLARLDVRDPAPWLRFTVPAQANLFEEPVPITIEKHGAAAADSIELQILDEDDVRVETATVVLSGGTGTYLFRPRSAGRFHVWTSQMQVPNDPVVEVGYPTHYALAALGALLGAYMALSAFPRLGRAIEGVAVGLVVFFLCSYARTLPYVDALPLPSLHASIGVNALASGAIGGWGGFAMLLGLWQLVINRLLPTPPESQGRRPSPGAGAAAGATAH